MMAGKSSNEILEEKSTGLKISAKMSFTDHQDHSKKEGKSKKGKQAGKGKEAEKKSTPAKNFENSENSEKPAQGPKIYKQTLKPIRDKKPEISWARPHRHVFSRHEVEDITGMVTKICECGFRLTSEEL
jgi:hypothetical protein